MTRDEVLQKLKAAEVSLRAQGISHAALFGSVARGEERPESDIDIMVEIAPDSRMGVYEFMHVVQSIESLFPIRVDVADREALKPHVRPAAEREALYAF